MRIVIDSLIALMLVGVVAGVIALRQGEKQDERGVADVQAALDRLHEQAAYHTAVQSAMQGHDTLLVHVHQAWFGEDLPTNVLLSGSHPWIDLAPPGDLGTHPPDPVATDKAQAGFWYNPTTGVFRARVTPGASEAQTLALYNEVNGTALDGFEQIPDPARKPIAHVLGTTPAKQYASMANQTWNTPKPKPEEQTQKLFDELAEQAEQLKQAAPDQPTEPGTLVQDNTNQADPESQAPASIPAGDRDASQFAEVEANDRPTLSK